MFFKRPKTKRFEYEPRFYKPEQDPSEKFRDRMRQELRKTKNKPQRKILFFGAILLIIFYAYLYLSGVIR